MSHRPGCKSIFTSYHLVTLGKFSNLSEPQRPQLHDEHYPVIYSVFQGHCENPKCEHTVPSRAELGFGKWWLLYPQEVLLLSFLLFLFPTSPLSQPSTGPLTCGIVADTVEIGRAGSNHQLPCRALGPAGANEVHGCIALQSWGQRQL